jgi:DNA-binding GntR family transcriptional regulator
MAEKIDTQGADGRAAASTLGEFAFQRIREDVLSGRLAPGTRLRFQMLQEMYDLNVGTLREGLARLTSEGLVLVEGQKGFRVSEVSRGDLNDLTELRMLVDTLALRLSIERGDLDWESSVVATFHQLSRAPRDIDPKTGGNTVWELRHRAFHRALVSGSNSPVLIQTHATLFDRGERYRRLKRIHRPNLRNTDGEHEAIMDATIRHDVDLACSLLRAHVARSRDSILAAFDLEATAAE